MAKFNTIFSARNSYLSTNILNNLIKSSTYSTQTKFDIPQPPLSPLEVYNEKIQSGELMRDSHQLKVLNYLQQVFEDVEHYHPPEKSLFSRIFSSASRNDNVPKGVYLYGAVGGGKTMLMDLFYDCCNVSSGFFILSL